jgi:hypothetical protein
LISALGASRSSILDLYSSDSHFDEMLLLEAKLPDELMQGGPSSWSQQAQEPGPSQQQLSAVGDLNFSSNLNLQREQQRLAQLLQGQQQQPSRLLKNNQPMSSDKMSPPTISHSHINISSPEQDKDRSLISGLKRASLEPISYKYQNTNCGELNQMLGDDKKIKMAFASDENEMVKPGDVKNKKRDADGHQHDTDMDKVHGIKRESNIDAMDVKIKVEPMSPSSSSDKQALVEGTEMKLEPVPNSTDKKKKRSKFAVLYYPLVFRVMISVFFSFSIEAQRTLRSAASDT